MNNTAGKETLFDAVGGLPTLERVHKRFYDKVYTHPWLGKFFEGHKQELIENRQTQFMGEKMGGPIVYPGKDPEITHRAMFITEELFAVRRQLLHESLEEFGLDAVLIERWLKIDSAFKRHIVNPSREQFDSIDLKFEPPIIIEKPDEKQP
jgi:hemoglobin